MYINLPLPDKKCSQCGAINNIEYITRGYKYYVRCYSCGHEKLFSTITTAPTDDSTYSVYTVKPPPEFEEF